MWRVWFLLPQRLGSVCEGRGEKAIKHTDVDCGFWCLIKLYDWAIEYFTLQYWKWIETICMGHDKRTFMGVRDNLAVFRHYKACLRASSLSMQVCRRHHGWKLRCMLAEQAAVFTPMSLHSVRKMFTTHHGVLVFVHACIYESALYSLKVIQLFHYTLDD